MLTYVRMLYVRRESLQKKIITDIFYMPVPYLQLFIRTEYNLYCLYVPEYSRYLFFFIQAYLTSDAIWKEFEVPLIFKNSLHKRMKTALPLQKYHY